MRKKEKKRLKTRQRIVMVIAVVLLVSGFGFLLFPTASNTVGQIRANSTIETFNETLDNVIDSDNGYVSENGEVEITEKSFTEAFESGEVDAEGYVINSNGVRISSAPVAFRYDLDKLHEDSFAYNKSLINNQGTVDTSDYSTAALNMSDYGLSNFYCYLSAPTIGLYLPVYLGANDSMMSCGAAHLSGTSLPVDEKNTNCAIAGHTGYIGRIFFDNIKKLKIGDRVSINNYWETIDYKVIDYKIVKPNRTEDIYIQPDRQLLTLITCISNGSGGADRYIVICEKE